MDLLEAKNADNEAKIKKQDSEIVKLKAYINSNPEPDNYEMASKAKTISIKTIPRRENFSSFIKAAPSSCRELSQMGHSLDGVYLVQNQDTKKIQTVFCEFATASKPIEILTTFDKNI